jgi:hypothetical protein
VVDQVLVEVEAALDVVVGGGRETRAHG